MGVTLGVQRIPACLSFPQVLSHGPGQGGAGRLAGRLLEVPTLHLQLLLLGESFLTRTQLCPLSSCHGSRLGHGVSDLLCLFKSRCVLWLVKVRGVFPQGWQRGHLTPAMSWSSGERANPTMLDLGSCLISTLPETGVLRCLRWEGCPKVLSRGTSPTGCHAHLRWLLKGHWEQSILIYHPPKRA